MKLDEQSHFWDYLNTLFIPSIARRKIFDYIVHHDIPTVEEAKIINLD